MKKIKLTPEELHKGNLVDHYGSIQEVQGVWCEAGDKLTQVYNVQLGDACLDERIEDLQPIKVTAEWLKKLGFGQLPHFTVMDSWHIDIDRGRQINVGGVGTGNEMVCLTEIQEEEGKEKSISDLIVVHNFDYDRPLYVHQLQNIYQSITKKPLTLIEG